MLAIGFPDGFVESAGNVEVAPRIVGTHSQMARGSLTVLIVDRDSTFTTAAKAALEADAFDVRLATDAAAARAIAHAKPIDCVFLEKHVAADFDAVVRMLRSDGLPPSAIILVVTPQGDVDHPSRPKSDVDLVIRKPIDLELVGGLIRQLYSQRARLLRTRRPTQ